MTYVFIACEIYDLAHRHINRDWDTKLHHLTEIILLLLVIEWVPSERDYIVYFVCSIGPIHRPLSFCLVALHEIHDVKRVRMLVTLASTLWIFGFVFAATVTVAYMVLFWNTIPLMCLILYPLSFAFFLVLDAPLWNHLQKFNELAKQTEEEENAVALDKTQNPEILKNQDASSHSESSQSRQAASKVSKLSHVKEDQADDAESSLWRCWRRGGCGFECEARTRSSSYCFRCSPAATRSVSACGVRLGISFKRSQEGIGVSQPCALRSASKAKPVDSHSLS